MYGGWRGSTLCVELLERREPKVKWINPSNIDPVIAQAVMEDDYEEVGDTSVTRLVRPAQIAALEHQYQDEQVMDVTDGLYMLEGRALHSVLAKAREEGRLQEHRLMTEHNGWDISGRFDVLYQGGVYTENMLAPKPSLNILKDYKVASVWSYILGGKADWEMQLNFYAYLASMNGIPVDELMIVYWFRDWQASKARIDSSYPQLKVLEKEVPLWPPDVVSRVFKERVELHQAARQGQYPPCSDEERWARPDTWAVIKQGAKRAYRVLSEQVMAEALAKADSRYHVEHRPGVNARCAGYCPVMPFCLQAKQLGVIPHDPAD